MDSGAFNHIGDLVRFLFIFALIGIATIAIGVLAALTFFGIWFVQIMAGG